MCAQETEELIEVVTKDKAAASVVQQNVEEEAVKVKIATEEAEEIKADAQKVTQLDNILV